MRACDHHVLTNGTFCCVVAIITGVPHSVFCLATISDGSDHVGSAVVLGRGPDQQWYSRSRLLIVLSHVAMDGHWLGPLGLERLAG